MTGQGCTGGSGTTKQCVPTECKGQQNRLRAALLERASGNGCTCDVRVHTRPYVPVTLALQLVTLGPMWVQCACPPPVHMCACAARLTCRYWSPFPGAFMRIRHCPLSAPRPVICRSSTPSRDPRRPLTATGSRQYTVTTCSAAGVEAVHSHHLQRSRRGGSGRSPPAAQKTRVPSHW